MTDKASEAIARGHRADALLTDPLMVEAFDKLEKAYFEGWKASDLRDTEGRERLFLAVGQLNRIRDHLKAVASSGKVEQATLALKPQE